MGNFRIVIDAVGGHGCERTTGDGGTVVVGCGRIHCPDCSARVFVRRLQSEGVASIQSATLTHWPGEPSEVIDDLVSGKRTGSFTPSPD